PASSTRAGRLFNYRSEDAGTTSPSRRIATPEATLRDNTELVAFGPGPGASRPDRSLSDPASGQRLRRPGRSPSGVDGGRPPPTPAGGRAGAGETGPLPDRLRRAALAGSNCRRPERGAGARASAAGLSRATREAVRGEPPACRPRHRRGGSSDRPRQDHPRHRNRRAAAARLPGSLRAPERQTDHAPRELQRAPGRAPEAARSQEGAHHSHLRRPRDRRPALALARAG